MILDGLLKPLPMVLSLIVLLLAPAGLIAGAWAWPSALWFLGVFWLLSTAGAVRLALTRPASFRVRGGAGRGRETAQPLIDALGLAGYAACMAGWLVFIPLDVFRLKLLPAVGTVGTGAGVVLVACGVAVTNIAVGQNQFASPMIQEQREQQVVQSGLYGLVRHPFYAGMLMVYAGMALWLGSYAALIAVSLFLVMTLARIVIEERFLRARLPEYADYARRVRSRLIPFVL